LERDDKLPVSFYIVSLSAFLFGLSRHTTKPIFTLYILDMGASLVQVGLILSVQSILMMVMRIPLMMISNRVGHNRMFLFSFFVQATASILYAIAPNPSWLYIIPFYQILASGSFNQLAMSTVSNMAPATRQGDALGRYMTFMSLGMFVGPVITGSLINHISYRQLFMVTAIFPAIGLGLFLKFKPKEIHAPPKEEESPQKGLGTIAVLKVILRDRNVLILTFIRAAYSMSNTVFTSLFAVFAVRVHPGTRRPALLGGGFLQRIHQVPCGQGGRHPGAQKGPLHHVLNPDPRLPLHLLRERHRPHHRPIGSVRGVLGDKGGDRVVHPHQHCHTGDQDHGDILPRKYMGSGSNHGEPHGRNRGRNLPVLDDLPNLGPD